jgi:hypothetical protein
MKMDWKIIALAIALVVVLSATIFVQVSLAAGGSGGTTGSGNDSSSKSLAGTNIQAGKSNQSSKANNTSTSSKIVQQSQGYVPGGGPAGFGLKIEGVGPHQKGWMGGPMNPWIYGPIAYPARMSPFGWGFGGMPASYLSAGINK